MKIVLARGGGGEALKPFLAPGGAGSTAGLGEPAEGTELGA